MAACQGRVSSSKIPQLAVLIRLVAHHTRTIRHQKDKGSLTQAGYPTGTKDNLLVQYCNMCNISLNWRLLLSCLASWGRHIASKVFAPYSLKTNTIYNYFAGQSQDGPFCLLQLHLEFCRRRYVGGLLFVWKLDVNFHFLQELTSPPI